MFGRELVREIVKMLTNPLGNDVGLNLLLDFQFRPILQVNYIFDVFLKIQCQDFADFSHVRSSI